MVGGISAATPMVKLRIFSSQISNLRELGRSITLISFQGYLGSNNDDLLWYEPEYEDLEWPGHEDLQSSIKSCTA